MSTLTIPEAREHLDELCASVAATGEPVVIERDGKSKVMLVPMRDADTRERFERLMRNPDYVRKLEQAAERCRKGEGLRLTVEELRAIASKDEGGH